MTERKVIPATPGLLEDYAAQYDDLWANAAQRESFRAYLQGPAAARRPEQDPHCPGWGPSHRGCPAFPSAKLLGRQS